METEKCVDVFLLLVIRDSGKYNMFMDAHDVVRSWNALRTLYSWYQTRSLPAAPVTLPDLFHTYDRFSNMTKALEAWMNSAESTTAKPVLERVKNLSKVCGAVREGAALVRSRCVCSLRAHAGAGGRVREGAGVRVPG